MKQFLKALAREFQKDDVPAKAAAFEDPRFPPISKREWKDLAFEISILTLPEPIAADPEDLPNHVEVGTDGLICKAKRKSGLLLPQVAPEWGWTAEEFLGHTCEKAGLAKESWKTGICHFEKFQAQVFSE